MPIQQAIEEPLAVAIIGRPNVGKSSLLNALAGAERSIVSPVAGTTRDAVDTEVLSHCLRQSMHRHDVHMLACCFCGTKVSSKASRCAGMLLSNCCQRNRVRVSGPNNVA